MIRNLLISILILFILAANSTAQTGGSHVYEFLNLTHSGLVTSLGGTNVSLITDNPDLSYHNPALLSNETDMTLALNYANYFAGINYGQAMFSKSIQGAGNFAAGITYLNYGSFIAADETGTITGTFGAAEYAFSLIASREIDSSFTVGLSVKPVLSTLEKYTSFGVAFDLGASWHSRNGLISAGFVLKNAGLQVTTYWGENRRKLPFEIQSGASLRIAHAPLRFSLTARHLEKFDLTADNESDGSGDAGADHSFFDNLMRHMILGVELIPHKNFYFSAGYNYQRRKELQVESVSSAAGFSWGFGINTSFLNIEFGRATYHLAGSVTNVSLLIRPGMVLRKMRSSEN
jgi:hypothetical protein